MARIIRHTSIFRWYGPMIFENMQQKRMDQASGAGRLRKKKEFRLTDDTTNAGNESAPRSTDMDLPETTATADGASPDAAGRRQRTRAADVQSQLRTDIAEGVLLPGQRLHLEHLSQKYGAGYSPIREALSHLAAEGLVTLSAYKGYRVTPISRADWLDILAMRRHLESLGLAMSMNHAGPAWLDEVHARFAALERAEPPLRGDRIHVQWEQCHQEFHRSLVSGCRSPWLLRFTETLTAQSARYLRLGLAGHLLQGNRQHHVEHAAILAAIVDGDSDLACALLRNHLTRTSRTLLAASAELFG